MSQSVVRIQCASGTTASDCYPDVVQNNSVVAPFTTTAAHTHRLLLVITYLVCALCLVKVIKHKLATNSNMSCQWKNDILVSNDCCHFL